MHTNYKIKSSYIKRIIRELPHSEDKSHYVRNLIWIEKSVLKKISSLTHIIFYKTLEYRYKTEFDIIFRELDYANYQNYLVEQKQVEDDFIRWQNESKQSEASEFIEIKLDAEIIPKK